MKFTFSIHFYHFDRLICHEGSQVSDGSLDFGYTSVLEEPTMRQRKGFTLLHGEGKRASPPFPPRNRAVLPGRAATLLQYFLWLSFRFTGAYFSTVLKMYHSGNVADKSRPHSTGSGTCFGVRRSLSPAVSGKVAVDIRAEWQGCEGSLICQVNGKEKSGFVITFLPTVHYAQNI